MSGSVEKRFARMLKRNKSHGILVTEPALCRMVERFVYAERNAALEEAARAVEGRPYMTTFPEAIEIIRALKSPAPRRAKRKATR